MKSQGEAGEVLAEDEKTKDCSEAIYYKGKKKMQGLSLLLSAHAARGESIRRITELLAL